MAEIHTLPVLMKDKPGVFVKVVVPFARCGFNIKSLTVRETEHPGISRMMIIVEVDEVPFE